MSKPSDLLIVRGFETTEEGSPERKFALDQG